MGAATLVLGVVSAIGCAGPGFDPPSIVEGPRLVAVVVEPPEAAPGEDVVFRPMLAAPGDEPLALEWSVDLSTAALAAAAGQTLGEPAAPITLPWDGELAVLSGDETARAMDALTRLIEGAPPGTPEHVVGLVYEQVGLSMTVNVVARDAQGEVVADGFKRFFLTPREHVTTNPPPPRFRIGDRWVGASAGDPFTCAPEGEPPEVAAGEAIQLAPEEGDEAWLETYPALDIDGRRIEARESAFYSWYATAGAFSAAITRAPDRAVEWTAPGEPGEVPIWLVVRDGHLGTSACRATVRVVDP